MKRRRTLLMWWIGLVWLTSPLQCSEVTPCPTRLPCECTPTVLNCSGRSLKDFPDLANLALDSFQTIDLSRNSFDHVPPLLLRHPQLRTLIISGWRNYYLSQYLNEQTPPSSPPSPPTPPPPRGGAAGKPSAKPAATPSEADFGLKHVSPMTFTDTDLLNLILDNNAIESVPQLGGLASLEQLDLSFNSLRSLDNYSFHGLVHLEKLSLSNNFIETIDRHAFMYNETNELAFLQYLDLSGNRLTTIAASVFAPLRHLRDLKLYNNHIHTIESNAFAGLFQITNLDLDLNRLRVIPSAIERLATLVQLKLASNQIATVNREQFVLLKHLRKLDLSYNELKDLPRCAFHGLENSLVQLSLTKNEINKLDACSFLRFRHRRFLVVRDNSLTCDCNAHWLIERDLLSYDGPECIVFTANNCDYESMSEKCNSDPCSKELQDLRQVAISDASPSPSSMTRCRHWMRAASFVMPLWVATFQWM